MPMGFPAQVGLTAYEAVRSTSEGTRQGDVSTAYAAFAAGGTQATLDTAVKNADIAHHRRLAAAAGANGVSNTGASHALRILGTGGA